MKKNELLLSLVFSAVYFFSLNGLGSLPNLSINFLLKDKIGLNAAQLAYFQALTLAAWVIKPLWGLISDCLPIFGSRRKYYLLLTSLIVALVWLFLGTTRTFTTGNLLAAISVAYMAYAFQDVVTDGLMVEVGKPINLTGQFQSIQWAAVYIAMIIAAFWGGHLSDLTQSGALPFQTVFIITAIFPALTLAAAAFFIREPRRGCRERDAGLGLREALRHRDIWILSVFIFFWNFSPSFGAPFFYYCVDTLHFSGTFLGVLQALGSFGALLGCILYGTLIVKIPLRKFLIFSVFAGVAVILFHYVYFLPALTDHPLAVRWIALISNFFFGVLTSFIFLSILNLSAKVCPQYAGGTIFALLMSFHNLGLMGSNAAGGALYAALGLKPLLAVSAITSLFVLFFMPFIPIPEPLTRFERFLCRWGSLFGGHSQTHR
jgi:predicted MFS family arabinose efflux permease